MRLFTGKAPAALAAALAALVYPASSPAHYLTGACIMHIGKNAMKMADMKIVENTPAFARYANDAGTLQIMAAKAEKRRRVSEDAPEQITLSYINAERPHYPLHPGRAQVFWVFKTDSGSLMSVLRDDGGTGAQRLSVFKDGKMEKFNIPGMRRGDILRIARHKHIHDRMRHRCL